MALALFYEREPKAWGGITASSVLASLPVVAALLLARRLFVRSAMSSAVKG